MRKEAGGSVGVYRRWDAQHPPPHRVPDHRLALDVGGRRLFAATADRQSRATGQRADGCCTHPRLPEDGRRLVVLRRRVVPRRAVGVVLTSGVPELEHQAVRLAVMGPVRPAMKHIEVGDDNSPSGNGQALHSVGPAELRHRVRVELRARRARGVGGAGASGRVAADQPADQRVRVLNLAVVRQVLRLGQDLSAHTSRRVRKSVAAQADGWAHVGPMSSWVSCG